MSSYCATLQRFLQKWVRVILIDSWLVETEPVEVAAGGNQEISKVDAHPTNIAHCKILQNEILCIMHIITRRKINSFIAKYPDSRASLENWYRIMKPSAYASFSDVKAHFRSADYVDGFVVFNISGNKYRLIAVIHYNRKKVYIRHILTHSDYDRDKWKKD